MTPRAAPARSRGPASKKAPAAAPAARRAEELVGRLRRMGSAKARDGMARYAIPSTRAFGIAVGRLRKLATTLGRDHELAGALWETGWYEARMLATFVGEPARVTPAQMDRWARDFDSWAITDTACFHLFDRTPHVFPKVRQWSTRREEFVRRAAFALLACAALHDRETDDEPFLACMPLIERAANDERNFVMKGVSWALRATGERSLALHAAALDAAGRLAESESPAARWVGRDALRQLGRPATRRRLEARAKKAAARSTAKRAR